MADSIFIDPSVGGGGGSGTVSVVDPIDGDGSGGSPLGVKIDGVTVVLNGSGELEAVSAAGGITQLTGDVTAGPGSGSQVATIANDAVTTAKILDENVTYAKIQDVSATARLLGRATAGAGVTEELTIGARLQLAGTVLSAGLAFTAGGADADQAMAVNTVYFVDISGYSADRTYTLPGTAAVGDICAIIITTGDTAFELIITATAGDTLNGIAGGTEWSRVFITGEAIYMTCVVANTAWIVSQDQRIPQQAAMYLSTLCDGEGAGTITLPTSAATPGAWTIEEDPQSMIDTSNGRITIRRAGIMSIVAHCRYKDAVLDQNYGGIFILRSGTTLAQTVLRFSGAASSQENQVSCIRPFIVDAYAQLAYSTQAGNIGLANTQISGYFQLAEML